MPDRSPRVFLSYTSELAQYPSAGPTWVQAALDAITRAGHMPVHRGAVTGVEAPLAWLCREKVESCDIYVGLVGFRYGSLVRDDPIRSYAELEYDTATAAGLVRLVFPIHEEPMVALPRTFFADEVHGQRQAEFRQRLDAAGVARTKPNSPDNLETLLLQALNDLPEPGGLREGSRRTYQVGSSSLSVQFGDILSSDAEVIVSSDDYMLSMGGGVSAAIGNRAGSALTLDAAKSVPRRRGDVVVTTAGALTARYVFHVVTIGPPPDDHESARARRDPVPAATQKCLSLLGPLGVSSIAFPALGTGAARVPMRAAASGMAATIWPWLENNANPVRVELFLMPRGELRESKYLEYSRSSMSWLGRYRSSPAVLRRARASGLTRSLPNLARRTCTALPAACSNWNRNAPASRVNWPKRERRSLPWMSVHCAGTCR
jgi:O-acetyl-ADP-ribose deacetylase (regulator of RNase III)